jgi:hypothetical protein
MKYRLPRKSKKKMKKKYQEVDSNFKITGSQYDGFTWWHYYRCNNKYTGHRRDWSKLHKAS